jgi:hypothetical protein
MTNIPGLIFCLISQISFKIVKTLVLWYITVYVVSLQNALASIMLDKSFFVRMADS